MSGLGATGGRYCREVNEGYLDHVRGLPCSVWSCSKGAEPHHLVSRGAGGSDLSAIPLCREHHGQIHQWGRTKMGDEYGINFWRILAGTLAGYLRKVEAADD